MSESTPLLPQFSCSPLDSVPVYTITLETYDIVSSAIDTVLKYDQLRSPQVHSFLIKPLVHELRQRLNPATLYSLLANMVQFAKQSRTDVTMTGIMATRSMVCEILSIKLLKEYSEDELMDALTFDFYPMAGSGVDYNGNNGNNSSRDNYDSRTNNYSNNCTDAQNMVDAVTSNNGESSSTIPGATNHLFVPRWQRVSAIELAIKAEAKRFLSHPMITRVLDQIWTGSIMFQSTLHKLHRANVDDVRTYIGYGRRGPAIRYNYSNASIFKLSRLRVPRYRHWLSIASFCVTLVLYVLVLTRQSVQGIKVSYLEIAFGIWSLGFVLDEIVGFTDIGFTLYVLSLWNIFDLAILILLLVYATLRFIVIVGPTHIASYNADGLLSLSYDVLASVAIFLFPRLFSILDHYENFSGMVIAVRKMSIDLAIAWLVIIVLSSGFWVAFTTAFSKPDASAASVAYDLMRILFGFTPAVWENWSHYSVIGRGTLLLYLFITHFVIMTILIAVLSNSFAAITENAHEEHQYLFAINTVSMIKSESSGLFSYVPPLNLLEWMLRPLYYFLPLRQFLIINRTIVKMTHFPILYLIYAYERVYFTFSSSSVIINIGKKTISRPPMSRAHSSSRPPTSSEYASPRQPVHRKKKRLGTRTPRARVSNYDLLDEVFRRPYKGTIRVKTQDSIDKLHLTDVYEADVEENAQRNNENNISHNEERNQNIYTLREINNSTALRRPSASTSNLADLFISQQEHQQPPHDRPHSQQYFLDRRPRLFSTSSSLIQNYTEDLALSPTRSASSFLGRSSTIRRKHREWMKQSKLAKTEMEFGDSDENDVDIDDDDEIDDQQVQANVDNGRSASFSLPAGALIDDSFDITQFTHRMESRMDQLAASVKNVEAILEELAVASTPLRQQRS